uniref:hypothetical protein n=1 Tax=Allofournierella sp. TaxID=1940256 RepID=UPI00307AD58B
SSIREKGHLSVTFFDRLKAPFRAKRTKRGFFCMNCRKIGRVIVKIDKNIKNWKIFLREKRIFLL